MQSNNKSSEALARVARLFKIVTLVIAEPRQPSEFVRASPAGSALGRRELAEACGCGIRTVQRDLALLA
jgi:hypothetical protein